jgi:hypothetical protein
VENSYILDRSISIISFTYSNRSKEGFARTVPWYGGGRVAAVAKETGVDSGHGDRQSRERWRLREQQGLREFWDEKRNDMGQATIYRFKKYQHRF